MPLVCSWPRRLLQNNSLAGRERKGAWGVLQAAAGRGVRDRTRTVGRAVGDHTRPCKWPVLEQGAGGGGGPRPSASMGPGQDFLSTRCSSPLSRICTQPAVARLREGDVIQLILTSLRGGAGGGSAPSATRGCRIRAAAGREGSEDGRGTTRMAGCDRKYAAGRGRGIARDRLRGKKVRCCPRRNKDGWPWRGIAQGQPRRDEDDRPLGGSYRSRRNEDR